MTIFHKTLGFRAAAAVIALSLAGCVPAKFAATDAAPTWRTIGPPGNSARIRVLPQDRDAVRAAKQRSEQASQ